MSGSIAFDNLAKATISSVGFTSVVTPLLNSRMPVGVVRTALPLVIFDLFGNYIFNFPTSLDASRFIASIVVPAAITTGIQYLQSASEGYISGSPAMDLGVIATLVTCGYIGSRLMNSVNLFGSVSGQKESLEELMQRARELDAGNGYIGGVTGGGVAAADDPPVLIEEVDGASDGGALMILKHSPGAKSHRTRSARALSASVFSGMLPQAVTFTKGSKKVDVRTGADHSRTTEIQQSYEGTNAPQGALIRVRETRTHSEGLGSQRFTFQMDFEVKNT